MTPIATEIYHDYIWKSEKKDLADFLYGNPPQTMGEAAQRAPRILEGYQETNFVPEKRLDSLKSVLLETNSRLGCLTPAVEDSIDNLSNGAVEAAHQSVVMGGPCYILNKAASAKIVASFSKENNLSAFFFVGDYDEVQAELVNVRTPLMGQSGNLISLPVPEGYEHSPVSILPLPDSTWYSEVENSIRKNYNDLFKPLSGTGTKLLEERLEAALAVTRWSFYNSETLGEWAQRIIGRLLNVEGDLGLPVLPSSNPEIRKLMTEGFEFLLAAENRKKFVEAQTRATRLIEKNGFDTGAGERSPDYVPFFYECQEKGCHSSRVEMHYRQEETRAILTGRCPSCGRPVKLEFDAGKPDLSEIAENISPRVDSRQFVVDTILPIVVHIGGGGETAYYAQVIPVAEELGIQFPSFLKYPRVYFNTPWAEDLSRTLGQKDKPTLHGGDMFNTIGRITRARQSEDYSEMNSAAQDFRSLLHSSHKKINQGIEQLEKERKKASGTNNQQLQITRLEMERYLSWVYGQYTNGKIGQEATWSWIEWAINSGFTDLFGPYERAYVPELKNGSTLFVNFMV
ncbi:MAG: bacillithiol biosynthesis protein BshC [Promethearchaeia archaeon]